MLHAVVMAGGSGTRFWPLSRERRPKQLLALSGKRPMIVETVERLIGLVPAERVRVVTNAAYADAVRAALPGVPARSVVPEPLGRDTAAAIGLACALVLVEDEDAIIAALPADHVVSPAAEFRAALGAAARVVEKRSDRLVTFGVKPTSPATGFGYIERGAPVEAPGDDAVRALHSVARFREKPDLATAREFVASGRHLWNAGIFVFSARAMLARIEKHIPALGAQLPALANAYRASGTIDAAAYGRLPKISIDYGVLEKDKDIVVMEATFAWDDVGSLAALARVVPQDGEKNHVTGSATLLDATGNIVVAGTNHEVALIGVKDLIVVHTDDATLVCRREDAERVKELVAKLKAAGKTRLE